MLEFFDWAFKNGARRSSRGPGLRAAAGAVTKEIRAAWGEVKAADGTPVWK